MVDFKELRAAAPEYRDLTDEKFIETIQQRYAPTWSVEEVADKVGFKLPTKPNSLLAATPNFFESGIRTYQQGLQPVKELLGIQSPEETAKNLAWLERRKKEIAPAEGGATAEGQKAIQSAQGWGDTTKAILSNPQAVLRSLGESVATFLPDLALAPLAGGGAGVLAKTIATRLAAKTLAPEAVAAAANVGKAVLIGGGSAKTEYASELLEILKDKGIDIESSSALQSAFSDPKVMADVKKTALLKAIPVGVFDAFSMGLAGRIIDPALGAARAARSAGEKLPLGSLAGRGAGELGLQAGLGGAGEALGQLSAHGEIKDKAGVLLEAFGELGGAPFEAYSNFKTVQKGREQTLALAEQEKAAQEVGITPQENKPRESLLSDTERERIAMNPTPVEKAIDQLSAKYDLSPAQTEAILSSNDEKARFFAAVLDADPKALNRVDPKAREEIQGLAAQFKELGLGETQAPPLALPAPSNIQTPYGEATPAQADKAISNLTAPRKVFTQEEADAANLGKVEKGTAASRLPITDEVENILKSNLPDAKKREMLLALASNSDIQQSSNTIATPRGEVIPQERMRSEELKVRLAEEQFNQIKGNKNPENSLAAARILADFESKGKLDQLKIPLLQQLVKQETGTSLPLKPASDILAAYRNLPKVDELSQQATEQNAQRPQGQVVTDPQGNTTYNFPVAPGQTTPRLEGPAQWGPLSAPQGVSPQNWEVATRIASTTPQGEQVTPRRLMDAGLSSGEAYKATRALRQQGIIQGKDRNERTAKQAVLYSNVLSPSNALNFLKNEYNGKNYGCM